MEQASDFILDTLKQIVTALKDKIVNAQTVEEAMQAWSVLEKILGKVQERERTQKAESQRMSGR